MLLFKRNRFCYNHENLLLLMFTNNCEHVQPLKIRKLFCSRNKKRRTNFSNARIVLQQNNSFGFIDWQLGRLLEPPLFMNFLWEEIKVILKISKMD